MRANMRKSPERIARAVKFWRNNRAKTLLLTESTIDLLKTLNNSLRKRKRFSLAHVQALSLAVSLIEAQLRDCLRLRVDDLRTELDSESAFLDIKIDPALFDQMRARRLTLGEFV